MSGLRRVYYLIDKRVYYALGTVSGLAAITFTIENYTVPFQGYIMGMLLTAGSLLLLAGWNKSRPL